MQNFDFISDYENGKPAAARAVGILFGGALLLLSAVTSAAFFFQYAPNVFSFLSPALSPYLSALTGVLCFEVASVAWSYLKARDADTATQLAAANVGAWGAMLAGLTVTAVYFALNSDLLANRLDDTAVMTVSILGGFLIILGIGGNFALGFVYRNSAAGHVEAGNQAELRAMQSMARHQIQSQTTKATLSRTLDHLSQNLPSYSKAQGAQNAANYLQAVFNHAPEGADLQKLVEALTLIDGWDDDEDREPVVSQNGRHPTRG